MSSKSATSRRQFLKWSVAAGVASGAVDVSGLVHGTFPLDEAAAAFERSRARGVVKVLLENPPG